MSFEKPLINPDKTGIASAVLCTVHCLVVPCVFLLQSFWKDTMAVSLPPWYEYMDYLFIIIGLVAVYFSTKHTSIPAIKWSLWAFWVLLAVSIIFSKSLHVLSYVASGGLVLTHFKNLSLMRKQALR